MSRKMGVSSRGQVPLLPISITLLSFLVWFCATLSYDVLSLPMTLCCCPSLISVILCSCPSHILLLPCIILCFTIINIADILYDLLLLPLPYSVILPLSCTILCCFHYLVQSCLFYCTTILCCFPSHNLWYCLLSCTILCCVVAPSHIL